PSPKKWPGSKIAMTAFLALLDNHFFSGRRRDEFIDKRCNNHRRIVAYGVLNCATSPTDHAMVDPGSYRFWVRNDSVLTTTCGLLLRSTTQFVRELPEASRARRRARFRLGS